jgi:DNA-binding MarR family transcriptional regulator
MCYIVGTMATEATEPTTSGGVLEEFESSPALMLALLGQEATRRLRDALDAHDLKPRQYHILGLLHDHGPMGQRELGEAIGGVDPSILVTLLNPLEAVGFVSRERDPADRRRHFESATRAQREVEDALFAGLDEGQFRQLRSALDALRQNLARSREKACKPSETSEGC